MEDSKKPARYYAMSVGEELRRRQEADNALLPDSFTKYRQERPVPMPSANTRTQVYESDTYEDIKREEGTIGAGYMMGGTAPMGVAPAAYVPPKRHNLMINIAVLVVLVIIAVILALQKD